MKNEKKRRQKHDPNESLYLPKNLRKGIEKAAKVNGRTKRAEIIYRVALSFFRDENRQ